MIKKREEIVNQLKSMLKGLIDQIESTTLTLNKEILIEKLTAKIEWAETCPEKHLPLSAMELTAEIVSEKKLLALAKRKKS